MNFTIDDTRKFLSNIYGWMTTNSDFTFISGSINDCSSDEYTKLCWELNNIKVKARPMLNNLSDSIEQLDRCVQQLKITIERERIIRKQAIRDKKRKKREE